MSFVEVPTFAVTEGLTDEIAPSLYQTYDATSTPVDVETFNLKVTRIIWPNDVGIGESIVLNTPNPEYELFPPADKEKVVGFCVIEPV
jgi:hypothetical protein